MLLELLLLLELMLASLGRGRQWMQVVCFGLHGRQLSLNLKPFFLLLIPNSR